MQLHLCVAVVLSLVLERLNIVHCMKPRHNLILHMQRLPAELLPQLRLC